LRQKGGGLTKNRKITALALLSLVAFAAVMGGVLLTAQAADTNTATNENTLNTATVTGDANCSGVLDGGFGGMGFGGHRGGPMGVFGGFGAIEVSTEFQQKVTDIVKNDSDVQNLIADGYNVTAIRPIIKTVVNADGSVTTKAISAIVMLQKDTSGRALVSVDIENAKVTRIVILTRTVIDKS
jgi:hypothetical protein